MNKRQIIKHFRRTQNIEQKEKFMREHNIKYVYDCHHNMTVWADDGILQLFPVK